MPTLTPKDTSIILGSKGDELDCRSLFAERLVFKNEEMNEADHLHLAQLSASSFDSIKRIRDGWKASLDERNRDRERASDFLEDTKALGKRKRALSALSEKADAHLQFLATLPRGHIFFAQLRSRLMVNMAGGVMENAGLCLDRFGMPYIPGSAVKGCARRMAIQELLDATDRSTKAEILLHSAIVFGWADTDWFRGRKHRRKNGREVEAESYSDFWWAMAPEADKRQVDDRRRDEVWREVSGEVARSLLDRLKISHRRYADDPVKDLPPFGGLVSFISAYPLGFEKLGEPQGLPEVIPSVGSLELDVVTVHHREYYSEPDPDTKPDEWEAWRQKWQAAPDIEEPVPNLFPAVAPGHVFAFGLAPLRAADDKLAERAANWLKKGLSSFGIGAKTNAGYGWFEDVTETIENVLRAREEVKKRVEARSTLEPDAAMVDQLEKMKEPELRGQINPFATEERFWTQKDERVQLTLLYFLLVKAPDLFTADRSNPKSKVAKSIANLEAKFPHLRNLNS